MTGSDASSGSSDAPSPSPSSHQAKAAKNASGTTNGNTVCKNCFTSTTPLWRRDENGAVLCNACGLFLKLHGRPRPISLKTDVIKSRNRKGNHYQNHHETSGDSAPLSPRGTPNGEERKRKQHTGNIDEAKTTGKATKRVKQEQKVDSSSDMRSAASTLENIMTGNGHNNAQPRSRPFEATSPTPLPHLSTLLAPNTKHSPLPPPATMLDARSAISSPRMLPQNPKQVYHMSSINDVLETASVREPGQDALSPPSQRATTIPLPPPPPLPRVGSPQPAAHASLGFQLRNEEEIIRLKTRINELELVTDLYKRHIFELDEKCNSLQEQVQQLKH
ncbi:GZF3 (YJL110C) and DAL80 (YKR034W) [Zygosaccharomyces parabailii]|nr:GZF3 (YJL110C) and DAL80 (YKR034W) [Zygosaccharomyces parabailii]CDH09422.1 uncharacterized protein ZBAI_01206 [Zygosaccharomyces bailii ISA1307]